MSRTIHKYPLNFDKNGICEVAMPRHAIVLSCQHQASLDDEGHPYAPRLMVWALHRDESEKDLVPKAFVLLMTGQSTVNLERPNRHLATLVNNVQGIVLHIFEVYGDMNNAGG